MYKNNDYEKVKKVIKSCKTVEQTFNARTMVYNFQRMYGEDVMSLLLHKQVESHLGALLKLKSYF